MSSKKVALVTGATRGLGKETALRLAHEGIHVLVGARDEASGQLVVAEILAAGGSAEVVKVDLAGPESIRQAAEAILAKHPVLNILVNNAGVTFEDGWMGNTTTSVSPQILRKTFDVNFFGQVELTQRLLPALRKAGHASIVNVSSILGSNSQHSNPKSPIFKSKPFAYNASKTALNAFTVHLAAALAPDGILVNSAHPGWVKTELGSQAAPMSIAEGAGTIVELALLGPQGPTGKYIHKGQELPW